LNPPPEESTPGLITEYLDFERGGEVEITPKKLSWQRHTSVVLKDNEIRVNESVTRAMKIFRDTSFDIEGEEKTFQAIKLNSDRTGSNGILKDNGDFYQFNHSQPDSEYNQEEGRWVFKEKISEEVVEEKLESHFEDWELGRGWNPP
jgi:hypothetical protein